MLSGSIFLFGFFDTISHELVAVIVIKVVHFLLLILDKVDIVPFHRIGSRIRVFSSMGAFLIF